ncbi:MAG TPA: DNA alkylation repair protein [Acholeplasma sp.]|jgi:3-methyladenine DNA glycosylase AlkD|nr:DNA alkylation repair protein [Acholeplasma sp.]
MIKDLLLQKQDLQYKDFTSKLLNDDSVEVIGVRTKDLREIAKGLDLSILGKPSNVQEIRILKAFVLGKTKIPFKRKLEYVDLIISQGEVTNWANTDTLASSLKDFKTNQEEGLLYIKKLLKSYEPFTIRLGLVFLLNYYVNDCYYKEALKLVINTNVDHYYVKMAKAWALCEFYIYNKDTKYYFKELDQETLKMLKQKIRDSFRIAKEDKEIPI